MSLNITATRPPLSVDSDGSVRIGKSRVTLRTLLTTYKQGLTPEEIAAQYSTLELADIYSTIGYYLAHQGEIDEYLREQEQIAATLHDESRARFASSDLHRRLLARHAEQAERQ